MNSQHQNFTVQHSNNLGLDAQNGWCGSANFYLTPDSYGNTFAEMNYQETIISP